MKTLSWINGAAQGLPKGCHIRVNTDANCGFGFDFQGPVGADFVFQAVTQRNHRTEDAAERAAESALWRLGVLPLPDWQDNGNSEDCTTVARMVAFHCDGVWRIYRDDVFGRLIARGVGDKSTAEAILRALIAAAVERGDA